MYSCLLSILPSLSSVLPSPYTSPPLSSPLSLPLPILFCHFPSPLPPPLPFSVVLVELQQTRSLQRLQCLKGERKREGGREGGGESICKSSAVSNATPSGYSSIFMTRHYTHHIQSSFSHLQWLLRDYMQLPYPNTIAEQRVLSSSAPHRATFLLEAGGCLLEVVLNQKRVHMRQNVRGNLRVDL